MTADYLLCDIISSFLFAVGEKNAMESEEINFGIPQEIYK